jgi:hypothetical protein
MRHSGDRARSRQRGEESGVERMRANNESGGMQTQTIHARSIRSLEKARAFGMTPSTTVPSSRIMQSFDR